MRLYNVRPSEREFSFRKISMVAFGGSGGTHEKKRLSPFTRLRPTYHHIPQGISEESFISSACPAPGLSKIMRGKGLLSGWIAVLERERR